MSEVDKDHDTEESDFDVDFKLEPLPRAADIIAELPDYPDSEEEEEVRTIMQMISTSNSNMADESNEGTDHEHNSARNDSEAIKRDEAVNDARKQESCDSNQTKIENNPDVFNDADEINLSIDRSHIECSTAAVHDLQVLSPISDAEDTLKRQISGQEKVVEFNSPDNNGSNLVRKSKRQRIEAPKTSEIKADKKVYLNKAGEFITGFDPASAEAKYRRQMRMQRFGKYEKIEKSKFDDSKLDISDCPSDEGGLMFEKRPDAIHLFGTDDLSTDDILEYFSEFSPHHIEWVDDSHCNVVWSDQHSVKRALLSLSKKYSEDELEEKKKELRRREKDEDDFYLFPGCLDRPGNDEYKGMWRMAIKDNAKAHLMFMRFANTGDIKKRGSYKTSRYYSLYGNPNAPHLSNNDYTKLKQKQSKRQLENKRTNMEMKALTTSQPPDLRRYLKKGSIDVEQIKEEYKVGKPLIETLTIEVDRSDIVTDVEVRKDNSDSDSEAGQVSENEQANSRTVGARTAGVKRRGGGKKGVIVHSSSSEDSSDSEKSDSESSSSSSSSSSDSSDSSTESSSSDSSDNSEAPKKKVKKVPKKVPMNSQLKKRRSEPNREAAVGRKPPSKSVISVSKNTGTKSLAVIRPSLKSVERIPVRKLSSQIKPVMNNSVVVRELEAGYRKKRRGRTPVSPNHKRQKIQSSIDLRAKIVNRSR